MLPVDMRAALLLAVFLTSACSAARGGVEDEVTMTTLGQGGYAASRGERTAVLATTDDEYQRLWPQLIGGAQAPPAVDFSSNVVVFLLAGPRNTGGWSIEPKAVAVEGDTAVIDAPVQGPPPDAMVTQAFTYPWAAVAVKSRAVRNVRWPS